MQLNGIGDGGAAEQVANKWYARDSIDLWSRYFAQRVEVELVNDLADDVCY
jgi:hypothetical protein